MPSPVGHAMAGLIVALASERRTAADKLARLKPRPTLTPSPWTFFLVCMVLAALPDLDYIYPPSHRGPTHSIGAAAIVTLITAAFTRWTTGRTNWRVAAIFGIAYGSHIVMDWLGEDPTIAPGVMALWPITDRLFMSGWDLFRSTWRIDPLAPANFAHNARTLAQEIVLLGPFVFWLVWRRNRY